MVEIKQAQNIRLNTFIKKSKEEVRKYNQTKQLVYLEQAAEKVYNAYVLLLERIYGVNIKSHSDVVMYTKHSSNKDIIELGMTANALHKMFYESGDEFFIKRNLHRAWSLFGKIKRIQSS